MAAMEKIVAYYWYAGVRSNALASIDEQKQKLRDSLGSDAQIIAEFSDFHDKKPRYFPELEKAIKLATQESAELVIVQLLNLAAVHGFAELLMAENLKFRCMDDPLVSPETLPAVVAYARKQREQHSESIRAGLQKTLARLGNPNAAREIAKVNRIKVENAVLFALIVHPLIAQMNREGLSQRKMVDRLNEIGFTAPEGGKWVLSQFQKVLERVKANELAMKVSDDLQKYAQLNYSDEQILEHLNQTGPKPYNQEHWDIKLLAAIKKRITIIQQIIEFHQVMQEVGPLLELYKQQGMSYAEIAEKLNEQHIPVPSNIIEEVE